MARMGDEGGARSRWRVLARILATLLVTVAGVVTLARLLGLEVGPLAAIVSFTPWFALVAVAGLALSIAIRAWIGAGAAGVLIAVHLAWLFPLFTADAVAPDGPRLTIVTVNASYGGASAQEILALVRTHDVDVLAVQELTPALADELASLNLGTELPFALAQPATGHRGIGLWSREQMSDAEVLDDFRSWALSARVETEAGPVTVLAVHPQRPGVRSHDGWDEDLSKLADVARQTAGAVFIVGDLNTTRDHTAFRALERDGFRDESDQAGAGLAATFPAAPSLFPLIAIDHVLVRDAPWTAASAVTVSISGTDHRALVVVYRAQ